MLETLRFAGAYPFEVWTFRAEGKVSHSNGVERERLSRCWLVGTLRAILPAVFDQLVVRVLSTLLRLGASAYMCRIFTPTVCSLVISPDQVYEQFTKARSPSERAAATAVMDNMVTELLGIPPEARPGGAVGRCVRRPCVPVKVRLVYICVGVCVFCRRSN